MEMVKQTVPRKSTFIENVDIEVCYPKSRDNESFIGVYDIGDIETCNALIDFTNTSIDEIRNGKKYDHLHLDETVDNGHYTDGRLGRDDEALFVNKNDYNDLTKKLNDWLQIAYDLYEKKYHIKILVHSWFLKIHKVTPPAGGYHAWHSEQAHGSDNASRYLTWIIYFNDVKPENGGETEFKFQGIKVNPKAGRVIMWPAGCTHLHRGNAAWSEKYYATGWFECDTTVDN
tara:strand:+ start:311 stop:1000 length:690 start_codon:yes stop_codon:yes gene_type:complete